MRRRPSVAVLPSTVVIVAVLVAGAACSRAPTVRAESGQSGDRVGAMRFAEGRVDIRSGPGAEHAAINYLAAGQQVLVGEPDERGWLAILDPAGDTIGFVTAASMADLPPRRSDRFFELEGLVVPVR